VEFLAPLVLPAAAARLGSVGSRVSPAAAAANPIDLTRKVDLVEHAVPAPAATVPRVGSPALGWSGIDDFRARYGVPTRHTIATGRADIPGLEDLKLEGASPLVRDDARLPRTIPGRIESPSGLERDRNHAEGDFGNSFDRSVEQRGMNPSDLKGTVTMRLSEPPCAVCRQGLNPKSRARPGVQATEPSIPWCDFHHRD